jgi:NRPS condensation-like uncharacterized protein
MHISPRQPEGGAMNSIPDRFRATLMDGLTDHQAQFNEMMIQMEMDFDEELDDRTLARAVDLTLDAEPVLGCRFVEGSRKPFFQRLDASKRSAFVLAASENEYEAFKSTSMDCRSSPQISVCLWHTSGRARLLLKVSHQVADAAGVKDVAAILSGIYRRLSDDRNYLPPPNIKEQRSLREVLKHIPLHAYPGIFISAMITNWISYFPPPVHSLHTDDGPRDPLIYLSRFIPSDRVSYLSEYGRAYKATLNDMIMVAAYRALAAMGNKQKGSHVVLSNTQDLRRYIPSGHAPAVANLSYAYLYWPDLGPEPFQDFADTLKRLARITGKKKSRRIGLDVVFDSFVPMGKIMSHEQARKIYRDYMESLIKKQGGTHWFTNTGPIDTESVNFGRSPVKAHILPPVAYPPLPCMFNLSGYRGTLTLSAGAYPTQKEINEKLLDAILEELPAGVSAP